MKREPRLPARTSTLTERQRQVLELIARGHTNFEIASALGVSLETVKYHVTEILTRLNVASREEAAQRWREERRPSVRLRSLFATTAVRVVAAGFAAVVCAGIAVAVVVSLPEPGPAAAPLPSATAGSTATDVPTASPTPTITPATGPYPLGTRTGIASVDRVLDAIDSGDLAQVQATFHYWPAPCKTFPPPGLLRCEAGEPNGTPIDGIGAEGTEGAHYRPSEVLSLSIGADLVDPSLIDPRLYAVVEIHNPTEPWYRYKIVFENGQAVVADDIGLTFFPCGCQRAPAEQVAWGIPKSPISYVLPPR